MELINIQSDMFVIIISYLETYEICKLLFICKDFHVKFLNSNFDISFKNLPIHNELLYYFNRCNSIDLSNCNKITDKGLEYLKGVHTIKLACCNKITDKGLKYLKGVRTIDLFNCIQI